MTKNVSKYVINKILTKKLSKLCFVTVHMWYVTSDITPDTLHMRVGEHGENVHVYSCNNLGVQVFKRNLINCGIL